MFYYVPLKPVTKLHTQDSDTRKIIKENQPDEGLGTLNHTSSHTSVEIDQRTSTRQGMVRRDWK